ncbi:hypothetical protein [Noviherbaspirillum aridicola]|uniref:Uncharacterized protein n=1 Tax=Noviherbaspirillum aridicola TaxID=2849687 RepID=A0ABQ4QAH5_9BURK|nr:hypothetical protein [Noviherbaspirillum aridicola]GIZ53887.1 hypothetical protein NCCP691_39010 [Noviherbaspirillum aridicola]
MDELFGVADLLDGTQRVGQHIELPLPRNHDGGKTTSAYRFFQFAQGSKFEIS